MVVHKTDHPASFGPTVKEIAKDQDQPEPDLPVVKEVFDTTATGAQEPERAQVTKRHGGELEPEHAPQKRRRTDY
jgi:hypothetical protein